ncbi:hypothetical protein DFJ43DRAFT_1044308 [Lentinula guzmanii]|uniref:Uncharacterized protein n=3 Tax=Lentinula TaxID=5352 RepID=A0AA38MUQ7_9AGAR|nr:hypothetical protein DFJ43DRAFT_1044308 [Lentinula guzmanii]KAJ3746809.1 hypothetical protein DFH05DRAFT_1459017 [Lentinula detonsa]
MASASTPQEGAKAARHFIHTYVDEDDDNEADSPLRRAYHDSIDRRNTSSPSGQLPCIPVPSTGSSTSSSSKRQSCTPVSTIGSETDSEDDDKIPKPLGEVGRPNRGGYTLRVVLKWKDERYHEIKSFINNLVDSKLDGTLPLGKQIKEKVDAVREAAAVKFPILDEYQDQWATNDFIKCRLKGRQVALRKAELERQVAEKKKKSKA